MVSRFPTLTNGTHQTNKPGEQNSWPPTRHSALFHMFSLSTVHAEAARSRDDRLTTRGSRFLFCFFYVFFLLVPSSLSLAMESSAGPHIAAEPEATEYRYHVI